MRPLLKAPLITISLGAGFMALLFWRVGVGIEGIAVGAAFGAVVGLMTELIASRISPRLDKIELQPAGQRRVINAAIVCLIACGLLVVLVFAISDKLAPALEYGFLGLFASTLYLTWLASRVEKKEERHAARVARRRSSLARRKSAFARRKR
ncbi:MAG: hypothetical protein ACHQ50_16630 [Fimbriimonadales bacterium]